MHRWLIVPDSIGDPVAFERASAAWLAFENHRGACGIYRRKLIPKYRGNPARTEWVLIEWKAS